MNPRKRRKTTNEDEQGDAPLERNLHISSGAPVERTLHESDDAPVERTLHVSSGAPVERNQDIPGLALTNSRFINFKSALSKIQFKDTKPTGYHIDYSQQHSERVRLVIDRYKSTVTSNMHSLHQFGVLARSCKGPSTLPLLTPVPNKRNTVLVDGKFYISHAEIIAAIRSHMLDTERALYNSVMMNSSPHSFIPESGDGPHFYDDIHREGRYTFITDSRNHALSDPENELMIMNYILRNDQLRAQWVTEDQGASYKVNLSMAQKWLQYVDTTKIQSASSNRCILCI